MQVDMFMSADIQSLTIKMEKVEKSTIAVRKGLFSRHTALEKNLTELKELIEEQQREIYKLKEKIYGEKNVQNITST